MGCLRTRFVDSTQCKTASTAMHYAQLSLCMLGSWGDINKGISLGSTVSKHVLNIAYCAFVDPWPLCQYWRLIRRVAFLASGGLFRYVKEVNGRDMRFVSKLDQSRTKRDTSGTLRSAQRAKFYWKLNLVSPRFVPFGLNLIHFGHNSDIPKLFGICYRFNVLIWVLWRRLGLGREIL